MRDRRQRAPDVVVVSQSAARALWPGADALGKRVSIGGANQRLATVVGIVPDTRYRDLREARASVYFPLRQSPFLFAPMTLAIRTGGDPTDMVPVLRRTLSAIDPSIGLAGASAFDAFLELSLAQPRLNAWLLGVFAAAALVIAGIGIFGVVTTMVVQRTREFGVRMALGATGGDLRTMVLQRGLSLAIVGLVIGLLVALSANRLLVALLYGVTPSDPLTMALVAVALLLIATLASLIPALSSSRVEPATALRAEG
ncbi:MAG: FtsX-like permease family protein [Gemmatimonadaceae bacterium]|nr:FtsX-like permease family protein [Gemmatimonadaceae bacterium]